MTLCRRMLACALVALAFAAPAAASSAERASAFRHTTEGQSLFVGAAEDSAKHHDPLFSQAKMTLARLAGYNAIRMTAFWGPFKTAPDAGELAGLQNAVNAANLNGIRVVLSVYNYNSKTTPLTKAHREQFAQYAASLARSLPTVKDFIVGNEPNLNMFWMPQFDRNGRSVAPRTYMQLLAQTYDALKAVSPSINVIGGSVSPRGQDKHTSKRHTHSPTRFIPELGKAFKAMKRNKPVMDTFAFHPYLEPGLPPTFKHPKSTTVSLNDYGKLVKLLGVAFNGTAQRGSTMPIIYDEFGYESEVPATRLAAYHGNEPASVKRVDEPTLGAWYKRALELTSCQRTVKGMLFFLVSDEPRREGWQSGVYYADDTPKSILPMVRDAAIAARSGKLGCKIG